MPKVDLTIDATEAEADLEALAQHASMTAEGVSLLVTKSYSSLILLSEIIGIAIPQWFIMMTSAAVMAGTMFVELAAAKTMSGILAVKAGMSLAAATLMFTRAMIIQQEGMIAENKISEMIQLINLWTPSVPYGG